MPDIYQGQELWDFSLVDPDNRRPVDFALRRKMLAQLQGKSGTTRSAGRAGRRVGPQPPRPADQTAVTWRTLQFRRQHAELFRLGDYVPLDVEGAKSPHVCAFARRLSDPAGDGTQIAVTIVPRLIAQLTPAADPLPPPPPIGPAVWADTRIILEGDWPATLRNVFTGQTCPLTDSRIALADALAEFPVALLTSL